jgi:hypothetical protein
MMQKHVWRNPEGAHGGSAGHTLFTADSKHQQIAFCQPNVSCSIILLQYPALLQCDSVHLPSTNTGADQQTIFWQHISFSRDGLRLLAVQVPAPCKLHVWQRKSSHSPFQYLTQHSVTLAATDLCPAFFPANSSTIGCVGVQSACLSSWLKNKKRIRNQLDLHPLLGASVPSVFLHPRACT